MPTHVRIIAILLVLLGVLNSNLWAKGLSTGFSEVTLEELEPGKTYSTEEAANLPLAVVNTGEEPVDLVMELLLPDTSELKEGYAPIPDLNWIKLKETEFKNIQSKEAAITDVLITIPNDEQYRGRKYQVFIWSHTVGSKIGVGLKSKLLFSIKDSEEEIK